MHVDGNPGIRVRVISFRNAAATTEGLVFGGTKCGFSGCRANGRDRGVVMEAEVEEWKNWGRNNTPD